MAINNNTSVSQRIALDLQQLTSSTATAQQKAAAIEDAKNLYLSSVYEGSTNAQRGPNSFNATMNDFARLSQDFSGDAPKAVTSQDLEDLTQHWFHDGISSGAPDLQGAPAPPGVVNDSVSTSTGSSTGPSISSGSVSTTSGSSATGSFDQGVQIDYASGDSIAAYEKRTGTKPDSVGSFIGMSNGSVDMSNSEKAISDAAANGVGTVQLSIRSGEAGSLSPQETSQLQQLASEAKAKGVTLQVRFGYEMNNSSVSGFSNPQTFQTQWAQAAAAVHAGGGQMVWCAQNADPSTLSQWVPKDPSTVDAVGVDIYHFGSGAIDPNEIKAGLENVANLPGLQGKPLTIPETGVALDGTGDDASKAAQWLSMLNDPSLKAALPNYEGYSWFDYNKSTQGDIDSQLSHNAAYIAALQHSYGT